MSQVVRPPSGQWRPGNKAQLERWQTLKHSALPLRATMVDATDLIPEAVPPEPPNRLRPRAAGPRVAAALTPSVPSPIAVPPPRAPPRGLLDGFAMLEAAHVDFPDEAVRAELSGRELAHVVAGDLEYFANLAFLDVSDNRLDMGDLAVLSALQELRLQCNGLRRLPDLRGQFPQLEVLDLSFNLLPADALASLASLPRLRELDLSGNDLGQLPHDMRQFEALEVLHLAQNQLHGDLDLLALSSIASLRHLGLARNAFRRVPADVAIDGFKRLESLDLSHNQVEQDKDVACLSALPRLTKVLLFGNPLLAAHEAAKQAAQVRGDAAGAEEELDTHLPDGRRITVVSAPPARVARKAGKGSYNSFAIATVREPRVRTTSEWRDTGNRLLAAEFPVLSSGAPRAGSDAAHTAAAAPTTTTAGRRPRARRPARHPRLAQRTADDGFTGNDVFLTHIGDQGVALPGSDGDDGDASGDSAADDDDVVEGADAAALAAMMGPGLTRAEPDPGKLRASINALRFLLKHPITSHTSVDDRPKAFQRPTALQQIRQVPKQAYKPLRDLEGEAEAARRRHAQTHSTLANIERVLEDVARRRGGGSAAGDAAGPLAADEHMASLIKMVSHAMDNYTEPQHQ